MKEFESGEILTAARLNEWAEEVTPGISGGEVSARTVRAGGRAAGDEAYDVPFRVSVYADEAGRVMAEVGPGRVWLGTVRRGEPFEDREFKEAFFDVFSDPARQYAEASDELPAETAEGSGVKVWLTAHYKTREQRVRVSWAAGIGVHSYERVNVWNGEEPTWRVVCGEDPGDCERAWLLAVVHADDEEPVTQLTWGDLELGELRGVLTSQGRALQASAEDFGWGGNGLSVLASGEAHYDFGGGVHGTFSGGVDSLGRVEFFLGPPEEHDYGGGSGDDFGTADNGGGGGGGGGSGGGGDGDDDDGPPDPNKSTYGYVGGEGIDSVTYNAGVWTVKVSARALIEALAGTEVGGSVTFKAGGTVQGSEAVVEMGLGATSAAAGRDAVDGSAELVFHGTNDVDASKKKDVRSMKIRCSPTWDAEQEWHISGEEKAVGSQYVRVRRLTSGLDFMGVECEEFYEISIDLERFKQAAVNTWRRHLSSITLSDRDVSKSEGDTVTGALSGTVRSMTAAFKLS